jgi:two-component system OmpR family response regulator
MVRSLPTILVADDDPGILRIVSRVLELNGFAVVTCSTGTEALRLIEAEPPVLALLDVRMPELDGISVCEQVRAGSDLPIIIITALEDESDAARALEAGADDYIRKPFGTNELVARVRAVLRRSQSDIQSPELLSVGPLTIDEEQHIVLVQGQEVLLSRTEFSLLDYLARNANRVLTHDQLLEKVWGQDYIGSNHVLRVAMSRLRQRINDVEGTIIETLPGIGYRVRRTGPSGPSPRAA